MSGSGNGWDNSYYTNSGRETFRLFACPPKQQENHQKREESFLSLIPNSGIDFNII
jgi:hypothetical protein